MKRKQNASVPSSPVLASLKVLLVFILIIGLCLSFYPQTAYATEVDGDSELVANETKMDTINEKALQTIENNGLTVKEVSLGRDRSAAITSDGSLYMWGSNMIGWLGDGTTENRTTPKKIESLTNVTAVSLGYSHSAAITSDGRLYMWGSNSTGQLGDGTTEDRTTPKKIESLTNVTAVSLGGDHNAAITSDGSLYTWGDNSYGRLGDGTTKDRTTPKKVESLSDVTAVSLGGDHSAAITSDGSLYTWGNNWLGQLGDGTTEDRTTPKKIKSLTNVTAVSLGGKHSAAITSDGSLYTWGNNWYGELGNETTNKRATPKKVDSLSNVTAVSLGSNHSVAITSDGGFYTWGHNSRGQLGDGTEEDKSIPTKVPFFQSGQGQSNETKTKSGTIDKGFDWSLNWTCSFKENKYSKKSDGDLKIWLDKHTDDNIGDTVFQTEKKDQEPWLTETGLAREDFKTIRIIGCGTANPLEINKNTFSSYKNVENLMLSDVRNICKGAFQGCEQLTRISGLTEALTQIEDSAFQDDINLKVVSGNMAQLGRIGANAFKNTAITQFDFGNRAFSIYASAFENCKNLEKIYLPDTMMYIKESAFSGCEGLKDVYYDGSNEDWEKIEIERGNDPLKKATLHSAGSPVIYTQEGKKPIPQRLEDIVSETSSTTYNPELALALGYISSSVYDENNIKDTFKNLGMETLDTYYASEKMPAYAIARKKLDDGSQLVLVTVRGIYDGNDPKVAFNIGPFTTLSNGKHKGFQNSADKIYDDLSSKLGGIPKDNVHYVLTGHSMGAGVSNLLSVKLFDEGVPNSCVYDYNFACPDVANKVGFDWNPNGDHNNIFNICNSLDGVTYIPGKVVDKVGDVLEFSWWATLNNWGKFGRTGYFDIDTFDYSNPDNLVESDEGYFLYMHSTGLYEEYLEQNRPFGSLHSYDVKKAGPAIGYLLKSLPSLVNGRAVVAECPVDVIVYDSNGNPVASVINNEPDYYDSAFGDVFIFVNGDKKCILLPADENYTVDLVATDSGEMDFTVLDGDFTKEDNVTSVKKFKSVKLEKGKKMHSDVDGSIEAENVKLYVTDGQSDTPETEVQPDGTETSVQPSNPGDNEPSDKPSEPKAPAFNDVDPSAWYAPFVAKAVQYGFMKGTSDTTFEPEGIFTREMAAQVLYNAFGNGGVSLSCGMQDVDQSRWYAPAVNWVVEHGYMRGTGNGFGVGQKITREEFARMLANYKGIDLNAIDTSVLNNYPDAGNLHDWGRTAMAWAVKSGILSGSQTDAGILLAPEQDSNRGMAAALFVKARDNNVI